MFTNRNLAKYFAKKLSHLIATLETDFSFLKKYNLLLYLYFFPIEEVSRDVNRVEE